MVLFFSHALALVMTPRLGAKVMTLRILGNLHRCIQFLVDKSKEGHSSLNFFKK
jgi:hypothetical protein